MLKYSTSMLRVPALALALLGLVLPSAAGNAQEHPKVEIVPNIPHALGVTSLAVSSDGAHLLSGSSDTSIKLWEVATGRLLRTFVGHAQAITAVAFSPDGRRLLSSSRDSALKLWDAASGNLIRSWEGHRLAATAVAFSPDGTLLLSAGSDSIGRIDNTLRLWDAANGRLIRTLEGHASGVTSVAFSADGTRVLSGSEDKTIKSWDAASGLLIATFVHPHEVTSVAVSADGTRLLSGMSVSGEEAGLKLWDAASGQLLRTFERSGGTSSVAFSPDGTRLLSGGPRGAKLWDAQSGQLLQALSKHELPVAAVAFSPDGTQLLSAAEHVKLWDAVSGQLIRIFKGSLHSVPTLASAPDGKHLLSGSADHTLKLWDAATGQLVRTFVGHSHWLRSVAFSSDGARALSGSDDNTLKLWDVASGQLVRSVAGHTRSVRSVAFSPDGTRLLSGSPDTTLKLWEAASGQLIRTLGNHKGWVEAVAVSPDGTRLLSGSDDRTLKLWDSSNGELVRTFEGHEMRVTSVAFSPDGTRLISGSNDKTLKLWDAATGQTIRTLEGHAGPVGSVASSPDGKRLLSGSWDKAVKLWDAASGQLIHTFEGHSGWVNAVAFLPDATRVISGSSDATVRVWNAATGEVLAILLAAESGEWLSLTPEGFFDASSRGAEMLTIVRGLEVFSIDQFYQALYRPDLVREKLAGDAHGKVREAAANLDLAKLVDSGRVPAVAITSHTAQDTSLADRVTVAARLTDRGGGVGRAEWRINGITVGVVEQMAATAGLPIALEQVMALDPGENTVEISAYNGANLVASPPVRARITWTGSEPTAPPRLFVLVVGINDYLDGSLKLSYAVPDAKTLADALKAAGQGHYEEVIITYVLDRDAHAAKLDAVFKDLAGKVRPRDVFLFFAAGHGKTLDGRYYFLPHDLRYHTDQSLVRDAIGQDRLQAWFARILAKKAVLMFDTCEAGSLTDRGKTSRGLEQKAALGRLIQATGRATLTASTATQEAYEGHGGHGVFTFALLDALARADLDNNGLIELAELIQHVDGLVPAISEKRWGAKQFPQMDAYGSNFPLARQVPALAPTQEDVVIVPVKPTHVSTELLPIFKETGGSGGLVQELAPFTTVTLLKREGAWLLIAREGKALGYAAATKLHKLN